MPVIGYVDFEFRKTLPCILACFVGDFFKVLEKDRKMLTAKWIWKKQDNYNPYNHTIIAIKEFNSVEVSRATMRITTDGRYRLFINDEWINDGPCRSWPEHFQYDEIDVTSFLKPGKNLIRIFARHWSVGTFHAVPKQAGLLAQLNIENQNGKSEKIITDKSWQVAECIAWLPNTPKVSIQMEPQEMYDARLEQSMAFSPATELYNTEAGPWKNLNPRDVALLTKKPFSFRSFVAANVVKHQRDLDFCIPAQRLLNGDVIEANHYISSACGICTVLELGKQSVVQFSSLEGFFIRVNGKRSDDDSFELSAGKHLVLAFSKDIIGHRKEKSIRIVDPPKTMDLTNPIDPEFENPWSWVPFPEYAFVGNDLDWQVVFNRKNNELLLEYQQTAESFLSEISDLDSFLQKLGNRAQNISSAKMYLIDSDWQFSARQVIQNEHVRIENPSGLMYDNGEITIVHPSLAGDVELIYDLGQQNCGYYDFELTADAGVEVDISGIEYIDPNGNIQHTRHNRNGMRYITKQGINVFTSLKRRSGRYIFITFRNLRSPIFFRKFQLIESTYPVNQIGSFSCSDTRLDKIWEMSALTLKLCMEDTFTDCPLYEQTLWVGDARNEALFAFPVFGATDIAKRCISLAGQSLERFPIVGCQVPSGWEIILPAWSFLWGISVWDYYYYSGEAQFLKTIWPKVIQNLKGAETMLNDRGLFSAPLWNMFDWSGIDDQKETVLHNSMLLVGAIDAAQKCARALNESSYNSWLEAFREKLVAAINQLWEKNRNAYLDAIDENGDLSDSVSQHTSFLSVLYDIVPQGNRGNAINNILEPPEDMVPVGSPFAMLYFYETLEKIGKHSNIIDSIYERYLPMLEVGATTVWEIFGSSNYRPGHFPTRSHCHAWSSAPLYFLNRIILGIKQTQPGGSEFQISPRLNGLSWAKGAVATAKGVLSVSWRIEGKELFIKTSVPRNVKVIFKENELHSGLNVHWDLQEE